MMTYRLPGITFLSFVGAVIAFSEVSDFSALPFSVMEDCLLGGFGLGVDDNATSGFGVEPPDDIG